jgi:hypothetical protein
MTGFGRHSKYVNISATLVIALVWAQAAAAQQSPGERPDIATLVQRISEAQAQNHSRILPYTVTRDYKVFGANATHPRTEVVAKVNFLPPNMKTYDIDQSTGGMGEKVIRHILDHEVNAARDPREMMVNEQNYRFDYDGEESVGNLPCYRLTIAPKHDQKDLLNATIWVDKNSYRIVRMEGEPAKSPSFWVKDVHLVLDFGEVAGMWMQTEIHALAHLRFGGEYKIVSQDLDYDVARSVATNTHPVTLRRRHSSAIMAASVR